MIPLNSNLSTLQRSGIRQFTNLAKTVPDCVMLTIGEPDFSTPEEIKAAALTSLFQNRTHYAPNQGVEELRREIAVYECFRGMLCILPLRDYHHHRRRQSRGAEHQGR